MLVGILAVTVKLTLSAKWLLVTALRLLAYERIDVDVVKVSLERSECSEGSFGATVGPVTDGRARPLVHQCIELPSFSGVGIASDESGRHITCPVSVVLKKISPHWLADLVAAGHLV
jgi:hypothetical protein